VFSTVNIDLGLAQWEAKLSTAEAARHHAIDQLERFRANDMTREALDPADRVVISSLRSSVIDLETKVRSSLEGDQSYSIQRIWADTVSFQRDLMIIWERLWTYHLLDLGGRYWKRIYEERTLSEGTITAHIRVVCILLESSRDLPPIQMWRFCGRATSGMQQSGESLRDQGVNDHCSSGSADSETDPGAQSIVVL
jgi:hypothetical protein